MPEINLTITISAIITLCALLSQPITSIINNRHLYKLRKLELESEMSKYRYELQYQQKLKVYQNFILKAGACDWFEIDSDYVRLNTLIHEAMLLCNSETFALLKKLQNYIDGRSYSRTSFNQLLSEISEAFSKELSNLLETN